MRSVLAAEAGIVFIYGLLLYLFWSRFCEGSLKSCLGQQDALAPAKYILMAFFRPFFLTPQSFFALIGFNSFGPYLGLVLVTLGNMLSSISVFLIAKHLGRKLIKPWLLSNLPQTYRFIHSQDFKVALLCRLVPVFHFDFFSILFGVADFRLRSVIFASLIGTIPEGIILAQMTSATPVAGSVQSLGIVFVCIVVVIVFYEFKSRQQGSSLYQRFKAMFHELEYEVARNNDVIKRYQYDEKKIPVLLIYGFFSSRRALTVLEKLLISRGYDVLSFNMGGLLGVFFTRGIIEAANFIDYKLKRQFERHHFDRVRIVSHSKGGLVALWWLLKLGGSKHCDKLVCMGTPFKGAPVTYLALITPLGYIWRDVWQMRPGSEFIRELHELEIPKTSKIYCFYSSKDRVAGGERAQFHSKTPSQVQNIPVGPIGHFDFLHRRDIADRIVATLGSPFKEDANFTPVEEQNIQEDSPPPSQTRRYGSE